MVPGDPASEEGMIDLQTYERLQAEEAAQKGAAEEHPEEDLLPSVSSERIRELKEKARAMIEERLKKRRKQRRLLRGGRG